MLDILKIVAAVFNISFGLLAIARPSIVARASHFRFLDGRGRAELQIAFGGFFIGFGIAALLLNDPAAYQLLGFGWLGGVAVRLLTLATESPAQIVDRSFIALALAELIVGVILVL